MSKKIKVLLIALLSTLALIIFTSSVNAYSPSYVSTPTGIFPQKDRTIYNIL